MKISILIVSIRICVSFLIGLSILFSECLASAGTDNSGGGGTVVFLPHCKRPILLDLYQFRIAKNEKIICDDDGEDGIQVQLNHRLVIKHNTSIITDLNGYKNRVFDTAVTELDRRPIGAPIFHRTKFTPEQATQLQRFYLKNWFKKGSIHDVLSEKLFSYELDRLTLGDWAFYFSNRDFKLSEASYYLDENIKSKFPGARIAHVAAAGNNIFYDKAADGSHDAGGDYPYSEDSGYVLLFQVKIWNQLSLKAQAALLIHERLRRIQMVGVNDVANYASYFESYLPVGMSEEDYYAKMDQFTSFTASDWDRLIQEVVSAFFERGTIDSTISAQFKEQLDLYYLFNEVYFAPQIFCDYGPKQNEFLNSAQQYLAKVLSNETSNVEFANMMKLKTDNGCIGRTSLIDIMLASGAPSRHIIKYIETLKLPRIATVDNSETSDDPYDLIMLALSSEYPNYSFVTQIQNKLSSREGSVSLDDRTINPNVLEMIIADQFRGTLKYNQAKATKMEISDPEQFYFKYKCVPYNDIIEGVILSNEKYGHENTVNIRFQISKIEHVLKNCDLPTIKKYLREIALANELEADELNLRLFRGAARNNKMIYEYIVNYLKKSGVNGKFLNSAAYTLAKEAIAEADIELLKRMLDYEIDLSEINDKVMIMRPLGLLDEAKLFAMIDFLKSISIRIKLVMPMKKEP